MSAHDLPPLQADAALAIDQVCDRYEQAWRQGPAPSLEPFVADAHGDQRTELFRELLHLDVFYRRQLGEAVSSADYASRFPDLTAVLSEVLGGPSPDETTDDRNHDPDATTPPVPATPGADPSLVPGYEVLGTLGRGGMGVVYKAVQSRLKRLVALKMILSGEHAAEQERERFRVEAEVIARLRHPNIVQIFEVGEHAGRPFFSMELCEGGSLSARLRGEPLQPREAASLVARLALAVQAAHSASVIHRDLKPGNILLVNRPEGAATAETGRLAAFDVRVTDFGLAKMADAQGQTQTGAAVGTPSYMAPEQAEGKKDVGPPADVWALGAILYECLTGRPPFRAATAHDTILQVIRDDPVPPRRLNAAVPRDLQTVALKCLRKDPARRYASAAELAEDLGRWLDGLPIRARPVGALESLGRWAVRRPWQAAVAVALAVLTSGAIYTFLAIGASRAEASEARSKREWFERMARLKSQAADVAKFHGLLRQARERAANPVPGWRAAALKALKEAASLTDVARTNRADLAGDLAGYLIGQDVERVAELQYDFYGYCSAWRPGTREVVIGQGRQMGVDGCRLRLVNVDTDKVVHELVFWPNILFRLGAVPKLDGVAEVAFSPDGRWLAAASRNGTVWLWDLNTSTRDGTLLPSMPGTRLLAFDADGRTLVSGSEKEVASWSLSEKKVLGRITGLFNFSAIDPKGGRVAVPTFGQIALYCTHRWDQIGHALPLAGHPVFSPDGRALAVRAENDVWLARPGERTSSRAGTLRYPGNEYADEGIVTWARFSPDGSLLLTLASNARHARLWEVSSGRLLVAMVLDDEVVGACFAPDGRQFLLHVEGRSYLYAITGGTSMRDVIPGPERAVAIGLAPDGTLLVRAGHSADVLTVWPPRPAIHPAARSFIHHLWKPSLMAFDPNRRLWSFPRSPKKLSFWDGSSPALSSEETWVENIEGVGFEPTGRAWAYGEKKAGLVGGGRDAVWTSSMLVATRGSSSIAVGRNNRITGWADGAVRAFSESGQWLRAQPLSKSPIDSLAIAPEEGYAAAGSRSGELFLVRLPDLTLLGTAGEADRHQDVVSGLAFVGRDLLLSAGRDGLLSLWDCRDNLLRLVTKLRLPRPIIQMTSGPGGQPVALLLEQERGARLLDLQGLLKEMAAAGVDLGLGPMLPPPAAPPPPAPPPPRFAGVEGHTARNGLRMELFADGSFEHLVKVRYEARTAFEWGKAAPDPAVPGPNYSVRCTGWFAPPKEGKYRLKASLLGRGLIVQGQFNEGESRVEWPRNDYIDVSYEGKPIPIRIEYVKTGEAGGLHTEVLVGQERRINPIPVEWLFPTQEAALRGR